MQIIIGLLLRFGKQKIKQQTNKQKNRKGPICLKNLNERRKPFFEVFFGCIKATVYFTQNEISIYISKMGLRFHFRTARSWGFITKLEPLIVISKPSMTKVKHVPDLGIFRRIFFLSMIWKVCLVSITTIPWMQIRKFIMRYCHLVLCSLICSLGLIHEPH